MSIMGSQTIKKEEIEALLYNSLQKAGELSYGLYEYDMEEHIDYWYQGLLRDKEDFVVAVNENSGHVAMVLITKYKKLYINEDGRRKLQETWPETYDHNMRLFIPKMADDLANGGISVTGVTVAHPLAE